MKQNSKYVLCCQPLEDRTQIILIHYSHVRLHSKFSSIVRFALKDVEYLNVLKFGDYFRP
jgi:hypothetical protein